MWNYRRFKKLVVAADAYDVLKDQEIDWMGNFKDTFSKYAFLSYDSMPSIYSLRKFIQYAKTANILGQYEKDINGRSSDLRFFIEKLIKFVGEHLKHVGSVDSDTAVILEFIAKAGKIYSDKLRVPIEIGVDSSSQRQMKRFMQNLLSMGYGTLNLINAHGIDIESGNLMYIVRGQDVVDLGASENSVDRNEIIERAIKKYPELADFTSFDKFISKLESGELSKEDLNKYTRHIKALFASGLSSEKLFTLVDAVGDTGEYSAKELDSLFYFLGSEQQAEIYLHLRGKLEQSSIDDEFADILMTRVYQFLSSLDMNDQMIESLLNDKDFIEYCHKQGEDLKEDFLFRGFSTVEVMEEYLRKNPEKVTNFKQKALDRLGVTKVQQTIQQGKQKQQVILKDGLALLQKAIDEGVIKKINPFESQFNPDFTPTYPKPEFPLNTTEQNIKQYDIEKSAADVFTEWENSYIDRMEQERQFTTVSKDDLIKYAAQMTILEFDANTLKNFLDNNKVTKLQIETIDFTSGLWRGVFVPRFPTLSGQPVPAIVIRTDAYDSLEFHKELASSLGFEAYRFTESTRRHEIAHALHYLAIGDTMMLKPEILNPELTPEEAYVMSPPELYARTHGDIPYLSALFDSKIRDLTVSKKIYEAAKEQWIHDIVNEKIHLMSGGTNYRRLMMEDESPEFRKENFGKIKKSDGTYMEIPDPYGAIAKILERQRNKLESMFHDLFSIAAKRDKRRGLISRKNRIKSELDSLPQYEYLKRINLEKELNQIESAIIKSASELIFNVEDVSTAVVKGYLKNYFTKITDAVAQGLLGSDLVDIDDPDRPKSSKPPSVEPEPPTATDISDTTEFMIGQSEKIPGGRKIDELFPVYTGKELPQGSWTFPQGQDPNPAESRTRPKGFFPGLEPTKPEPQSKINIETKEDDEDEITDPFVDSKTPKVFNFRNLKRKKIRTQ
jgi:hypothetical protein